MFLEYDVYENYHGSIALMLHCVSFEEAQEFMNSRPGDFFMRETGTFIY